MSYLVLARKWRPQTFEDIAGQAHIARTLQNAIRASRIAHAYLFTGVRGVGKTTAARILAKALNCEKGPTPTPCNECSQCVEITSGSAIDVLEIDGASNRGIDEIRQIIENVRYQPAKCRFKIYIIDEVHQVTKDAFNALLKTLEEPPPSVKFILATTEPHRLPETILSRCQRYDFRRIALREIVQRLGAIAKAEGLQISEGALIALAREADGSMRDAQSLLEQVLASAGTGDQAGAPAAVDEQLLVDMLGLGERQTLHAISQAVISGDAKSCVERIAEASNQGRDLGRISRDLVEHFRNLLVVRLATERRGNEPIQALDLPDQEVAELGAQVKDISVDTLLDYFDFMVAGDEGVSRSANPRFALEATLIRLATLPQTLPVAQLLERLEKLEGKGGAVARPPAAPRPPQPQAAPAPAPVAAVPSAPVQVVQPVPAPVAQTAAARRSPMVVGDNLWQEFVTFVGREKKFLGSHLESGTPLDFNEEELHIGVAEKHHLSYLQDPENLAALKNLAKQFFARDLMIKVAASESTAAAEPNCLPAPAQGSEERSEMVKEALRIFGGSVRSVRRDNR
ncbi:MAG: DNA polymerase III subunit gamma/tau [Deltaproteobacteria bacterium]|nr:DNA polymerase III subunit gamma/tau [Deltaproteobacteria bacterium]